MKKAVEAFSFQKPIRNNHYYHCTLKHPTLIIKASYPKNRKKKIGQWFESCCVISHFRHHFVLYKFLAKAITLELSPINKIAPGKEEILKEKRYWLGENHSLEMPRRKRARKIDYFEQLPEELIEKILALTATHDLKGIGNIKKMWDLLSILWDFFSWVTENVISNLCALLLMQLQKL